MDVKIANSHCIKALLEFNPTIIKSLEISARYADKYEEIISLAKQNQISIKETRQSIQALCKAPVVRDIKSDGFELGNLVIILDEIQDTRNLGSCLRSASFFGADSVIIPKNNSAEFSNPAVIETSTGGIYDMKLYKVSNISQTIKNLQKNDYWVSGFSEHGATEMSKDSLTAKNVLIFGNEEKGVRRLNLENCDQILKISSRGQTSSLNVAVATAIGMYEVSKCTDIKK
tara:strand:+ start:160 stop:849 length:690 start_codon:yes stop_codon:yes gene_type:complete